MVHAYCESTNKRGSEESQAEKGILQSFDFLQVTFIQLLAHFQILRKSGEGLAERRKASNTTQF